MLTWIRRLLGRRRHEATDDTPVTQGQRDADAALARAETARARVEAQGEEVRREAGLWRRVREENHLSELIVRTVLGGER
ncbi:DUF7620 family protein [Streptomyces tauricus]